MYVNIKTYIERFDKIIYFLHCMLCGQKNVKSTQRGA